MKPHTFDETLLGVEEELEANENKQGEPILSVHYRCLISISPVILLQLKIYAFTYFEQRKTDLLDSTRVI